MTLMSGVRWYRSLPTPLTQIVIASGDGLWVGGDPTSPFPYGAITENAVFSSQSTANPVSFASVYDPNLSNGNGGDILIMCGLTGPYQVASAALEVTAANTGDTFAMQYVNGGTTVTTTAYTVLATDTPTTICTQLAALTNESAAVMPGTPFLGQSYSSGNFIYAGARVGGAAGNSITMQIIRNGAGVGSPQNLLNGGNTTSQPLKYDGTNVSALSYQIARSFTRCVTWHDHVWFWGDSTAPTTLFASDINQPEGFSFMTANGGYDIGKGDGDPSIRACIPIGNILYVFKASSIYAITGYDFQSGEYQFQVQPVVIGTGTPSQECVAVLNNTIVFWSGRRFCRLAAGSFEIEHIGKTIPITEGRIASDGDSSLIRAVAGDFTMAASLNESYTTAPTASGTELLTNVVLFAVDVGNGVADTVLVYDDDATQDLGNYAWSLWTGWKVGAWIPFGKGPSASGKVIEPPLLCWIDATTSSYPVVNAYGTLPLSDNGNPIPWLVQTGWETFGTGALQKLLHRMFLEIEATPGALMSFTITPSVMATQAGNPIVYESYSGVFGAAGGVTGAEAHQTLIATINPELRANAFIFAFGENTGTASFEMIQLTLDYIEEPFES